VTADDSNDNRSRILDAAATEFMNAGFDATSIDEIACRIGQTKSLIYYHFRSKIDIFYAVYERGMRQVSDEVVPQVSAPGTGMERLRRIRAPSCLTFVCFEGFGDQVDAPVDAVGVVAAGFFEVGPSGESERGDDGVADDRHR
jgi:AcrR family transcriptional regulator